jgi:glycosyltransferase involved in cell wall biosynthesis
MAGRLHTARAIRSALDGWADLSCHRLPSVLTDPAMERTFGAALAGIWSLFSPPLLPLQCALFASRRDLDLLIDALPADLTSVYLDGVRSYSLLVSLRRARPRLRIVTDLDDLMTRRMDLLLQAGETLSPGYLTKHLPGPLLLALAFRPIGRLIVRFERSTLRRVERRIRELSDAVVLTSEWDAAVLQGFAPQGRAEIVVIAPPSPVAPSPTPFSAPARFVFVGSDALTQNRRTIDYLVDLWRRFDIRTPLVLYGLRSRDTPLPEAVSAPGYVERIEDVYDGRSVLLTPSWMGGGLKTKVLEAFAYGAAVIGNDTTFEAIRLPNYPLTINDEAQLVTIAKDPTAWTATFAEAARIGMNYIATDHDPDTFRARWRAVMAPGAAT